MSDNVVVRMAPSPTGFLHVGTARTAIFNYLFARHSGGKFILRIEDTDVERSSDEMTTAILDALKWLNIEWDGEIFYQSQRFDIYREHAEQLIKDGKAYYCYCTADELKSKREKAQKEKRNYGYDRKCLNLSDEQKTELDAKGTRKTARIKMSSDGLAKFDDVVTGEITRDYAELDDWVIMRPDGRCTYNFSCVVDDHLMEITHIIRGNDHITNTFKQCGVYDTIGWDRPAFVHIPLILGKDRAKISKRHGAVSVTDYKDEGVLPDAMFNFLTLLGWNPGDDREVMNRDELIKVFTLERINATNPIFDPVKLEWMNSEYIRNMDNNAILEIVRWKWVDAGLTTRLSVESHWQKMIRIIELLKERVKGLNDFVEQARFFLTDNFDYEEKGLNKHLLKDPAVTERLTQLRDEFSAIDNNFRIHDIEDKLRGLAEKLEIKVALLIHPARMALTGSSKGPGLFELMEVLGKDTCLKRIDITIELIKTKQ